MAKFDRPRGTQDYLPRQMAVRNCVESVIRRTFESFGFQQVQTPTFEKFELLSARSGEEIRESMFTFVSDREEYALRPELTAPVCRLIAGGRLDEERAPRPYKLYYVGQCFRYCRPQAGRYREFTQAGLELMGSADALADAEVIAVAVRVLENLGITGFNLKIGNIGIFRSILAQIYPDDFEQQSRIIGNIDNIMSVWEKVQAIEGHDTLTREDLSYIEVESETIYSLQEEIDYSGEYEILPAQVAADQDVSNSTVQENARAQLKTLVSTAEDTYRSKWVTSNILDEKTAHLLLDIARTRGPLAEVLPRAQELLAQTVASGALDELQTVGKWLGLLGVSSFEVVLGVARGLDFYTSTVFEVDFPGLGAQKQICGGGRYDRLVEEFGGPSIPATGFAFGFDRVCAVFEQVGKDVKPSAFDVFVARSEESCKEKAVEIGDMLRRAGFRSGVDLMGNDLREQLGYADQMGTDFVVILGPEELAQGQCRLRRMSTREEELILLDDVAARINAATRSK